MTPLTCAQQGSAYRLAIARRYALPGHEGVTGHGVVGPSAAHDRPVGPLTVKRLDLAAEWDADLTGCRATR
jgi:hypothetical protein